MPPRYIFRYVFYFFLPFVRIFKELSIPPKDKAVKKKEVRKKKQRCLLLKWQKRKAKSKII